MEIVIENPLESLPPQISTLTTTPTTSTAALMTITIAENPTVSSSSGHIPCKHGVANPPVFGNNHSRRDVHRGQRRPRSYDDFEERPDLSSVRIDKSGLLEFTEDQRQRCPGVSSESSGPFAPVPEFPEQAARANALRDATLEARTKRIRALPETETTRNAVAKRLSSIGPYENLESVHEEHGERAEAEGCEYKATDKSREAGKISSRQISCNKLVDSYDAIQTVRVIILSEQL